MSGIAIVEVRQAHCARVTGMPWLNFVTILIALPAHSMSASKAKAILLIELLETGRSYDAAEVLKKFHVVVNAHGVSHVSTAGSKIICTHADSDAAAATAFELMACSFPGGSPMQPFVRMCICQFPGKIDSREAHASAIAAAARELVKANAGQIITTQETAEKLSDEYEIRFIASGGNSGKSVFEVTLAANEDEDATRIVPPAQRGVAPAGSAGKQIHLRWRGKDRAKHEIVLNSLHPVATFGREDSNDIVIESSTASRQHGKIECRRDSILIIDESTNGTFVSAKGGEDFFVHRDKKILPQSGYISLGERLGADHPSVIQFITGFSVG